MRTPEQSHAIMRGVRNKNTKPELSVRKLLHRMGFRYRLHRADLPGKPDVVFPKRRKVVFVHGCFWHSHSCPSDRPPRSRLDFWQPKLERTKVRDLDAKQSLQQLGWDVLTIWECELSNLDKLTKTLLSFLCS